MCTNFSTENKDHLRQGAMIDALGMLNGRNKIVRATLLHHEAWSNY